MRNTKETPKEPEMMVRKMLLLKPDLNSPPPLHWCRPRVMRPSLLAELRIFLMSSLGLPYSIGFWWPTPPWTSQTPGPSVCCCCCLLFPLHVCLFISHSYFICALERYFLGFHHSLLWFLPYVPYKSITTCCNVSHPLMRQSLSNECAQPRARAWVPDSSVQLNSPSYLGISQAPQIQQLQT